MPKLVHKYHQTQSKAHKSRAQHARRPVEMPHRANGQTYHQQKRGVLGQPTGR
jgi:hypothetical protein